jgi:hypothetical protein
MSSVSSVFDVAEEAEARIASSTNQKRWNFPCILIQLIGREKPQLSLVQKKYSIFATKLPTAYSQP